MLFRAFYAYFLSASWGLQNCISSSNDSCLACSTFLTGKVCTPYCPSMYTAINSNECTTRSSCLLFISDFSKISFPESQNSYDPFINPENHNFLDPSQKSPLKTKDRGLYFNVTSYMYTDYENDEIAKISPDSTVKVWMLVEQGGDFFGAYDSDNNFYYKISAENTYIIASINTCYSDYSCGNIAKSVLVTYQKIWIHLIVFFEFYYTKLFITIKVNKDPEIKTEVASVENSLSAYGSLKYYWKLGSIDSTFKGFIYLISVLNSIDNSMLDFIDPPVCMSNQYWDGGCYDCNSNCPLWPWCVRGSDCEICYSNKTSDCYGYSKRQTSTISDCYDIGCTECNVETYCTKAELGMFVNLILDENNKFFAYVDKDIEVRMTDYRVSRYMKSGENEATYYFNNPEYDDYIPVPCRGYYFVNGMFGETRMSHFVPTSFNIFTWIKGYSGPAISKSSNLVIFANGTLNINITSYDNLTYSLFTIPGSLDSTWHHLTYKIQYDNFDTSIIQCINLNCEPTLTFKLNVFRDSLSPLIIGKSNDAFYNGFLLIVVIGTSNYNYYMIESDCIKSECGPYESPNDNCDLCDFSCSDVCVLGSQCGPCFDKNCKICHSINTCYICKDGFILEDNYCVPNFNLCSNNTYLIGCPSCPNQMYLIDNVCKNDCPTGFSLTSNNLCEKISSILFDLDLANIIELSTIGVFTIGINSTNIYPDIDDHDPFPVKARGYYFNGKEYMKAPLLVLHHTFYLSSWLKVISNGRFVNKFAYSANMIGVAGLDFFYFVIYNGCSNIGKYFYKNLQSWSFIEITLKYESSNQLSTLTGYYNSIIISSKSISLFIYQDDSRYDFIIGNYNYTKYYYKENFFKGYIWSMTVKNEDLIMGENYKTIGCTGCVGTQMCSKNLICQSGCSIDSYDPNCDTCNGCMHGCVNSDSCSLCDDVNCYRCTSFSNCDQCLEGYYYNNIGCSQCHPTCLTCLNYTVIGCVSCISGYMYYQDMSRCLPSILCSSKYEQDSITKYCYPQQSLKIFSLTFDLLQGAYNDTISQILIQSGETDAYYPAYELSDVIATIDRGVYFKHSSFMFLQTPYQSNLILGHTFTISLWMLINADGIIFSRFCFEDVYIEFSAKQGLEFYLKTLIDNQTLKYTSTVLYDSWHLIQITKQIFDEGEMLKLYIDSNYEVFTYSTYYQDPIYDVLTLFGDSLLSFQGFLWSVEISNTLSLLSFTVTSSCIYPKTQTSCIPVCSIATFYQLSKNICENCLSNCESCSNPNNCSLCSDQLCLYCPDFISCTQCKSNNLLINDSCYCNIGFIYDSLQEICVKIECFTGCSVCSKFGVFDCLECENGFEFLEGICEKIPTGYANINTSYMPEKSIAFELKLDGLKGILYDSVSKVPVLTGNSQRFYPDFDEEDPIPAYLRGYYFNGLNSIMRMPVFQNYTKNPLILPPSWGTEIWFMAADQGPLIYSNSGVTILFTISISSSKLALSFYIANLGQVNITSSELIFYNKWNSLYFFLNYNQSESSLTIYINKAYDKIMSLGSGIFVNVFTNTSISIGAIEHQSYFKGFIYYLAFYIIDELSFSRRSLSCLMWNGVCLPECQITDYWEGPDYNQCKPCLSSCLLGCRNEVSCNLCDDPLCKYCASYTEGECSQCVEYADNIKSCTCQKPSRLDLISNLCVVCKENEYFDGKTCVKCPDRCAKCDSNKCSICVENSKFIDKNCVCVLGYNGTEYCSKSILNAVPKLTNSNNLILTFDSPLSSISINSITLTSCVSLSFTFEPWSLSHYYIPISYSDAIPEKCSLKIVLNIYTIISIYNGILQTESYNLTLYSKPTPKEAVITQKVLEAKKDSETKTRASTAVSISVSMLNPNPACLWSFVNTIQMLCFISFSNVTLPAKFDGQLKGLKKFNLFPNIFEYFVTGNGQKKPFYKAYEFGYKTNMLLLNSGNYLSAFLFMLFVLLSALIMRRFTHIKPFSKNFIKNGIENTVKNYKYGAFIRFWITCYMEVFAAALIAVTMFDLSSVGSIVNFIISIIFIVFSI